MAIDGYLLSLAASLVAALSQILLKKAANSRPVRFIAKFMNPLVLSGYFLLLISMTLNMLALRTMPMKYIPLTTATGFFWVALLSYVLLGERPSQRKILGTALVMAGIVVSVL